MHTSSEDSDSDSGTNFKRGKRKPKEDSPPPVRRASRVETHGSSHNNARKDVEKRRNEIKLESNGDSRRLSPERSRHKREASNSKNVRPKPSDKHDRREAKDDRQKREEVKRRRSRSHERNSHRPSSPKQRHIDDVKKVSTSHDNVRPQPKHQNRSKSPSRQKAHSSSSSHKESKERLSRERQHSSSRHAHDKPRGSIESKKHSDDSSHAYGPALPPPSRAAAKRDEPTMSQKEITQRQQSPRRNIGPSLPSDYRELLKARAGNYDVISSEDDDCAIGPMPTSVEMSERDLELEKRKIEIKLQQLDRQREAVTNKDVKYREEWMLELPEVRRVGDVGVTSRQFRKNDRPDFSDRTDWTKAPNDEHKKPRQDQKKLDEDKKRELEIKRRDHEQEMMAKEHKKSHKRDKSLLEIHEKKLKKEKKKLKDEKKERRPFNRDSDLSINKFDDARKKALCKKAQLLDTRFSSGNKRYL